MAGQQFLDVLAMKTKVKGPSNSVRLCADENGTLLQSIKGASFAGFVSGDKKDMFKARAQAFISGEFTTYFEDFYGAATALHSNGATPTAAIGQLPGRGGSMINFSASGASGHIYQSPAIPAVGGVDAYSVSNIIWTPWYVESQVILRTWTAPAEIFFVALAQQAILGTDGTSGQYIAIGIFPSISTTNISIKSYNGSVVSSFITPWLIEFNTIRKYGVGNDGMGTLAATRDGAKSEFPMFPAQAVSSGQLIVTERALGGTISFDYDYFAIAGVAA